MIVASIPIMNSNERQEQRFPQKPFKQV